MRVLQHRLEHAAPNDPGAVTPPPVTPPVAPPVAVVPPTTPPVTPPSEFKWPDDWRARMSGGDEKIAKSLERYASPDLVPKALVDAQTRISQGFKPEPFPDKGTPEQQAAWRTAQGLPTVAADFVKNIGDGIVIGDADKPVFDSFAEAALQANLSQAQFTAFSKWYDGLREELISATEEKDRAHTTEVDDALIKEMGPAEYRASNAMMASLIDANFPEKMRNVLLEARDESGRKIITHPEMRKALFQLARTVNPAAALIPSGGGGGKSVDDELAEIKAVRDKGYDAFMKNEKLRARERELLDIKSRLDAQKR